MLRGLYCGVLGMMTEAAYLDVVANNLANVSTVGYKYDHYLVKEFEEDNMLRLHEPTRDSRIPIGLLCNGLGVESIFTVFTKGPFILTNNPLDLALEKDGFFVCRLPDGREVYTRAGNFTLDKEGFLVNMQGYRVQGEEGDLLLTSPNIKVDEEGKVYILQEGESIFIDKLKIRYFEPRELEKIGYTLFSKIPGAEEKLPPQIKILQGYLENSNVNPISELVKMIKVQRLYELNQRAVLSFDDIIDRAINNVGRL